MRRWWLAVWWLAALGAGGAAAQLPANAVLGRWLTEDRDGVVEIFRCDDSLCGRLVWLKDPIGKDGKPPVDRNNPQPALRGRTICGLVILSGFKPSGPNAWDDGQIYNPDNGKSYSAQLTLESRDRLRLRGYIGIPLLGGSQIWTRVDPSFGSC
jgi:uncharacterized protein (DUF2147 family)